MIIPPNEPQITDTILMVRPAAFGFNPETAANNAFQIDDPSLSVQERRQRALAEFDAFVARLREAGIRVIVVEDTAAPVKTDAVFPNNWISTHGNGTLITYPMYSPVRRRERREAIVDQLRKEFQVLDRIHLEENELTDRFLEGTGSLILDREYRIAYACLSERTDEKLLRQFAGQMNYEIVAFTALDGAGQPIYHTNVMMALGETFVVVCLESIRQVGEQDVLLKKFAATKKEVIAISLDQMNAFAGNMLQVRNGQGKTFLVMSQQAYDSLRPDQIETIERHTTILSSPLPTIETYGGGSARCMMAEIFLPRL